MDCFCIGPTPTSPPQYHDHVPLHADVNGGARRLSGFARLSSYSEEQQTTRPPEPPLTVELHIIELAIDMTSRTSVSPPAGSVEVSTTLVQKRPKRRLTNSGNHGINEIPSGLVEKRASLYDGPEMEEVMVLPTQGDRPSQSHSTGPCLLDRYIETLNP